MSDLPGTTVPWGRAVPWAQSLGKWYPLLDFVAAAAVIVTLVLDFPREIQSVLG